MFSLYLPLPNFLRSPWPASSTGQGMPTEAPSPTGPLLPFSACSPQSSAIPVFLPTALDLLIPQNPRLALAGMQAT